MFVASYQPEACLGSCLIPHVVSGADKPQPVEKLFLWVSFLPLQYCFSNPEEEWGQGATFLNCFSMGGDTGLSSSSTTKRKVQSPAAPEIGASFPSLSGIIQSPWHPIIQNCPQLSFLILFHLHTLYLLFSPAKFAFFFILISIFIFGS